MDGAGKYASLSTTSRASLAISYSFEDHARLAMSVQASISINIAMPRVRSCAMVPASVDFPMALDTLALLVDVIAVEEEAPFSAVTRLVRAESGAMNGSKGSSHVS